MAKAPDNSFPTTRRMAEYAARNGKPNAHVQSASKGAQSSNKTAPKGPASPKSGCSCQH